MKFLLGASALTLALVAGNAQAGCIDGGAGMSAEACSWYTDPYQAPAPVEYGTRTEVYLDDGRVTRIREHLSSDENDETVYYGDTYDEFDELDDEDW